MLSKLFLLCVYRKDSLSFCSYEYPQAMKEKKSNPSEVYADVFRVKRVFAKGMRESKTSTGGKVCMKAWSECE